MSKFNRMRAQVKVQILLLASFLLLVLLASGLIYVSVSNYSHNDFYRLLKLRASTAARVQLEGMDKADAQFRSADNDYFERLPGEYDFFIKIEEEQNYHKWANEIGLPDQFFHELIASGEAQHHDGRLFFIGIMHRSERGEYAVIVQAENYYESHHFVFLRRVLIATVLIGTVLAFLISSFLSSTIFKPLWRITLRVNQISSESLHLRLDKTHSSDELSSLVTTFNNMLDRIETSFETQNNFISNASHEFRTPLTAIMGEAEVALAKSRTPGEYEDTLKIILQEAEKLDKKTHALLFLAQTGFHGKSLKGDIMRADQLLWDAKETIQNINPRSKINFDLSKLPENPSSLMVYGNEQLLHLAFSNIINNACKYSDFKTVLLSLEVKNSKILVSIRDEGIGIPIAEQPYIYDPFFRASNTEPYEGYGIGMPLSRNIIRMHQGEILVNSEQNKGTQVTIVLPQYQKD